MHLLCKADKALWLLANTDKVSFG